MAAYPDRIRQPRSKEHVHAAESQAGYPDGVTACRKKVAANAEWHEKSEPVTCPACIRALSW